MVIWVQLCRWVAPCCFVSEKKDYIWVGHKLLPNWEGFLSSDHCSQTSSWLQLAPDINCFQTSSWLLSNFIMALDINCFQTSSWLQLLYAQEKTETMALVLHVDPTRSIILEFGIKGRRYLLLGCVNGTTRCPLTTYFFFTFFWHIFIFFDSCHFFQFCKYYSEIFLIFSDKFFLSFLHLTKRNYTVLLMDHVICSPF